MDCLEESSFEFSLREEGVLELLCYGGKVQSVVMTCLTCTLQQEKKNGKPRDEICEERGQTEIQGSERRGG